MGQEHITPTNDSRCGFQPRKLSGTNLSSQSVKCRDGLMVSCTWAMSCEIRSDQIHTLFLTCPDIDCDVTSDVGCCLTRC